MLTTEEQKQVASTILQQLGGAGKVGAMIGVKHFVAGKNGELTIQFKAKALKKINCVRISLNGKDLYDVEFIRLAKYDHKVVETKTDIYADQLKQVFEQTTGLYLSLF
jgi:hypothetical protein